MAESRPVSQSAMSALYATIAHNLREFGYADVTADMIRDTHEAMEAGAPLPHGVVGMFAQRQLQEALDA